MYIKLSSLQHKPESAVTNKNQTFFDVLLTMHLSIILVSNELNAQNLVL